MSSVAVWHSYNGINSQPLPPTSGWDVCRDLATVPSQFIFSFLQKQITVTYWEEGYTWKKKKKQRRDGCITWVLAFSRSIFLTPHDPRALGFVPHAYQTSTFSLWPKIARTNLHKAPLLPCIFSALNLRKVLWQIQTQNLQILSFLHHGVQNCPDRSAFLVHHINYLYD